MQADGRGMVVCPHTVTVLGFHGKPMSLSEAYDWPKKRSRLESRRAHSLMILWRSLSSTGTWRCHNRGLHTRKLSGQMARRRSLPMASIWLTDYALEAIWARSSYTRGNHVPRSMKSSEPARRSMRSLKRARP